MRGGGVRWMGGFPWARGWMVDGECVVHGAWCMVHGGTRGYVGKGRTYSEQGNSNAVVAIVVVVWEGRGGGGGGGGWITCIPYRTVQYYIILEG